VPSSPIRDPGEFLDVDVDQLTGLFPLVTSWWLRVGGPVTSIEAAFPGPVEDPLHGGGSQPDLEGDMVRSPAAPVTKPQYPFA